MFTQLHPAGDPDEDLIAAKMAMRAPTIQLFQALAM
jgi:hypothetical protein